MALHPFLVSLHGLSQKTYKKPFTQQGTHEVKTLVALLDPCIVRNKNVRCDDCHQIFLEIPLFNLYNHFSSFHGMHLLGANVCGATLTFQHDCIPKGYWQYLHSEKLTSATMESKATLYVKQGAAATYYKPKDETKKDNVKNHVSF